MERALSIRGIYGRIGEPGPVALAAVLALLLLVPVLGLLVHTWRTDPSLSHGPVVVGLAFIHLWLRRGELRREAGSSNSGAVLLIFAGALHVLATWADVAFLRPLSLIGMAGGAVWLFTGWKGLKASVGALGFLLFAVGWPTTLVEGVAFPLQLMSSAYAALLGGLLGLPIQQEGVHLFVVPQLGAKPVYSIMVARQCSGLTSLLVLLALGYLIAYHTPLKLGWRMLLLLAVIPLTLLMNAVRLTLILLAGTHHSASLATWVHDNEAPFLIFFCSLGLIVLRQLLLAWAEGASCERRKAHVPTTIVTP